MSKQLTAIIVDDEKDACDGFEALINTKLLEVKVIAKAENAQNALEIIIDKHPDLVFLDIQMPVNDGFWLAEKLKKFQHNSHIIFVTAYDEYSIKAIKYAAFDFLTKPVSADLLKATLEKYTANKNNYNLNQKLEKLKAFFQQDKIKFNIYNGFILVSPADIVYCEAEKNYCNIYLSNGKKEFITSQLSVIEKKLTESSFVKVSRTAIINIDYFEVYDRKTKTVTLSVILQKFEIKVTLPARNGFYFCEHLFAPLLRLSITSPLQFYLATIKTRSNNLLSTIVRSTYEPFLRSAVETW